MRSTAFTIIAMIPWLSVATPATGEPRGGYEQMFGPLRDLLAPCREDADRCAASGKSESICRAEAEQCVRALEEVMKEQTLKELEKEDPSARRTMTAIDAHQACVSTILDCVRQTKQTTYCVERAPRCRAVERGEGVDACCPSACIDAYQARVGQGANEVVTFADIFIKNPTCFPGVPISRSP